MRWLFVGRGEAGRIGGERGKSWEARAPAVHFIRPWYTCLHVVNRAWFPCNCSSRFGLSPSPIGYFLFQYFVVGVHAIAIGFVCVPLTSMEEDL